MLIWWACRHSSEYRPCSRLFLVSGKGLIPLCTQEVWRQGAGGGGGGGGLSKTKIVNKDLTIVKYRGSIFLVMKSNKITGM